MRVRHVNLSATSSIWATSLLIGSVVCPKCEEYCDHCEKGKKARTDPSAYLEDLDDTCFQGSSNTLSDFLKAFTIKLG